VESLVGRSGGLANELNLIADLDCMLSMDSANMHLASLVGTRAVSVWGATHPAAGFLGFNQNPDDAVQVDLPCRPCSVYGNKPCHIAEQYKCLNSITAEGIVEKILG
ncbi:MAG: glycosyl transferase family 1, partial [Bacteroidales bacterium]|nr:glycosyl transferase family 1 [Bacteroidales bacterium]